MVFRLLYRALPWRGRGPEPYRGCPATPDALVFICLSVVPPRLPVLDDHLAALLDQNFPADILLAIPDAYSREFSAADEAALREYVDALARDVPSVHIVRGPDTGPSSKLLLPLRKLQDTSAILIIVDDDQFYAASTACDLLVAQSVYPGRAIARMSRTLAQSCSDLGNYLATTRVSDLSELRYSVDTKSDILMGTSSYAVRASFFSSDVFSYNACPIAVREAVVRNDDIWISAHLRRGGVPLVTVLSGHELTSGYIASTPERRRAPSDSFGLWQEPDATVRSGRALRGVANVLRPDCHSVSPQCRFGLATDVA